jgi:DNA-binding response OmpR family regulator
MRVLVVEDDLGLSEALATALQRAGHAVDVAHRGGEALDRLGVNRYDVMVLDLRLPDGDGLDVCRATRNPPLAGGTCDGLRVLILTSRGGLDDRITGLDSGADDYLVKPFVMDELLARVRALLRRAQPAAAPVLSVADVRLDPASHEVTRAGRALRLTRKEFGVLDYLMRSPGRVVSAEELLEHVWDEHANPFTETVRVTIGTLRRKLTEGGEPPLLHTVIGRGYRLAERS